MGLDSVFFEADSTPNGGSTGSVSRSKPAAVAGEIDDAHVYGSLVFADLRSRRFGDAVAALREAVRRDPSLANAHFNLRVALLQTHGPAAAQGEFETAAHLAPGNRNVANNAARWSAERAYLLTR